MSRFTKISWLNCDNINIEFGTFLSKSSTVAFQGMFCRTINRQPRVTIQSGNAADINDTACIERKNGYYLQK